MSNLVDAPVITCSLQPFKSTCAVSIIVIRCSATLLRFEAVYMPVCLSVSTNFYSKWAICITDFLSYMIFKLAVGGPKVLAKRKPSFAALKWVVPLASGQFHPFYQVHHSLL